MRNQAREYAISFCSALLITIGPKLIIDYVKNNNTTATKLKEFSKNFSTHLQNAALTNVDSETNDDLIQFE